MSRFNDALNNKGTTPIGKRIEFYIDCPICYEEVTEVDFFPNEKAILYVCSQGHRNVMEGIDLPL